MALIRRGVIRAFDRDTYVADVEMRGYQSTLVTDVPVGLHVRADLVVDGVECVVIWFDELDPTDAVVVALVGGKPGYDPKFDPVLGHKHRGLIDDGPLL